ncbi:MAG TPA: xanthine dehydrogenase family protein subunit M [Candidatus Eisenbacteria bacterium]|nr:xanthine dehydrogenase family protein subunit M [Candidatus Eisenbacteria bacterium]
MIPAPFDYVAPRRLEDALGVLAERREDAKILAGGHSLLPLMKLRLAQPALLVDLGKLRELKGIERRNDQIVIGAMATHYEIESSELLKKYCPLLSQTAARIGDVQVRNRGTIGGSLVHADPGADWPAAVIALGAELRVAAAAGERVVSVEEFFTGPMTTALEQAEILTEIRVPIVRTRSGSAYVKIAQPASGFAVVGVAACLKMGRAGRCDDLAIGITGLAAKPFRARAVEQRLRGEKLDPKSIEAAAASAAAGQEPLDDLHASAEFRANLARVCAARAVQQAARDAAGRGRSI